MITLTDGHDPFCVHLRFTHDSMNGSSPSHLLFGVLRPQTRKILILTNAILVLLIYSR